MPLAIAGVDLSATAQRLGALAAQVGNDGRAQHFGHGIEPAMRHLDARGGEVRAGGGRVRFRAGQVAGERCDLLIGDRAEASARSAFDDAGRRAEFGGAGLGGARLAPQFLQPLLEPGALARRMAELSLGPPLDIAIGKGVRERRCLDRIGGGEAHVEHEGERGAIDRQMRQHRRRHRQRTDGGGIERGSEVGIGEEAEGLRDAGRQLQRAYRTDLGLDRFGSEFAALRLRVAGQRIARRIEADARGGGVAGRDAADQQGADDCDEDRHRRQHRPAPAEQITRIAQGVGQPWIVVFCPGASRHAYVRCLKGER